MPVAIAAAIASITVTQVVFAVASFAISTYMSNRAQKKAEEEQRAAAEGQRAAYNSGLVDRTSVVRTGVQPRNIILGRDEASGPLACWFTYGPLRNFHAFAVVLAGHQCDAVETVCFNHEPVTMDGNGWVTSPTKWVRTDRHSYVASASGGPSGVVIPLVQAPSTIDSIVADGVPVVSYSSINGIITILQATTGIIVVNYTVLVFEPLFRVRAYLGAPGQAAAPELVAAAAAAGVPASWDASRKGTNVCYLSVVAEADFNIIGQIGIPNVSAITRGARAYDPRTGLTAWTQNPPLLARWFNVDSGYAPQTLDTEIDADELLASANVSDELIAFSAVRLESRYTCNGQLTTAASPMDNFNHILDAMDGDAVWVSGQWQIIAGYYKEPTLHLDEDKLSGAAITVVPRAAKRDLFNGLSGTYVNATAGFVRTGYELVTSDFYQLQDGGELLPSEANFELVNDAVRCQMIAWQRLTRARQPLTLSLGTTLKGYDTAPLQNVTVSLRRLGYDNKVFSNLRREFEGGTLLHVLQETGPQVWAWNYADASAAVDIPNTSYPDVFTIAVPTGIQLEAGTAALLLLGDGSVISRARIRWQQASNTYVLNGGKVEWQYKSANVDADDWTVLPASSGEDVETFTGALVDGDIVLVRGRFVTGQGRKGNWSVPVSCFVVGKTEPPPDIIDLSISGAVLNWSPVDAPDLKGYIFRFQYGSNFDWGSAVPMHTGLIVASPFDLVTRPNGVVTIMGKALDTTGNESVNAGVIVTDLGDPVIANVVETFDFGAASFPGTVAGGAFAAGALQATSTSSAYGTDDQSFYGLDNDPAYGLNAFSQMVYVTNEVAVSKVLAGSIMTLLIQYQGIDLVIEYRLAGPGSVYGSDGDSAYGPDADSFYDGPGSWIPWPGQIVASNDVYQLRVTIGAGSTQGVLSALSMVIDAPDIVEYLNDVVINAAGTVPAYTEPFTVIKTVTPTLQANASGAETIETNKAVNLAPVLKAYNAAHVAVSGATADIILKGY